MYSVKRRSLTCLLALLIALGALAAAPAQAGDYRGAKIEWCWDPPIPDYLYGYFSFFIEIDKSRNGEVVGDTFVENLFGISEPVTMTVTEIHDQWFRAKGTIESYYLGGGFSTVGLDSCCRIDGTGDPGLNNRNGGNFRAWSRVYDDELCSAFADLPGVIWLSGGLGDTFEIPLPVEDLGGPAWAEMRVLCRFASDAEAGGGPNPDGMTLDPETCTITWTPTTGDPGKLWTTQVQAEHSYRHTEFVIATTPIDFLLGLDPTKPACVLQRTEPGPPTRIHVLAQDARSGIEKIEILEQANATVDVPSFSPGTTAPLNIVGTKINQAQASRIRLRVTDQAGNSTECDPVLTEVVRETGKPQSQTFGGVPPEERAVTVFNGNPGLKSLDVEVNGLRYRLNDLAPGEQRTLDVGAAVQAGVDSTFVLTSHGKPGGSAVVMIWEGEQELVASDN